MLNRLRNGQTTLDDWGFLKQRMKASVGGSFKDALRLFATNEKCSAYNLKKLVTLKQPIARIDAMHKGSRAKNGTAEQASRLEPTLFLSKEARVMLTRNICTEQGLINGSFGTVKALIYETGKAPPSLPQAVIVQFPSFKGKSCLPDIPNCVAITTETAEWWVGGTKNSRVQFPLKLGWAITIHKSQGLTLTKAVVDLSDASWAPGLHFVALSRVRRIEDVLLAPFPYDSLNKHDFKEKNKEELRLNLLFKATQQLMLNAKVANVCSMDVVDCEDEEIVEQIQSDVESLCESMDVMDLD